MRSILLSLIIITCFSNIGFAKSSKHYSPLKNIEQLDTFIIGSCNKQNLKQPLWDDMLTHNPQFYMWLGDNVYGDTNDMSVLKGKYKMQLSQPGYQRLMRNVPVVGIWDDHDYGQNNAGKEYPMKEQSQQLFMNFIGEPTTSSRREQKGIYTSYYVGQGNTSNLAKVIMLDTRFHREAPGQNSDMLGKDQWRWLESELATSKASVHFIISSISVLSRKLPGAEGWINFPASLNKLMGLIDKYKVPGVMFLTGDRHFSGVLARQYKNHLYFDLMSSGLTHYTTGALKFALQRVYGKKHSFFGYNFGKIELDWKANPVQMRFSVVSTNNQVPLTKTFERAGQSWKLIGQTRRILKSEIEDDIRYKEQTSIGKMD